ncbi:MAG: energy transducer TonB [Vicingaceae bacterium]
MVRSSLAFFLLISMNLIAQKVDFYPGNVFPAEPYGGKEELSLFVKQRMVYPKEAREQEIEGKVSVQFKVNAKGQVSEKIISKSAHEILTANAIELFDEIVWTKNEGTSAKAGNYNEVIFHYDLKKYKKAIRKRDYDELPYPKGEIDSSAQFYNINQVDEKPKIANAKSVNGFVSKNFKYPSLALQRNISGRVSVEFIIEPYGLISNLRIIKSVAGGCDEETKRLVREMEWTPGKKDGKYVRTLYRYDLNFMHPGGSVR